MFVSRTAKREIKRQGIAPQMWQYNNCSGKYSCFPPMKKVACGSSPATYRRSRLRINCSSLPARSYSNNHFSPGSKPSTSSRISFGMTIRNRASITTGIAILDIIPHSAILWEIFNYNGCDSIAYKIGKILKGG